MTILTPITTLTAVDWAGAAWLLRVDIAAIRAIGIVETGEFGPFLSNNLPTILFERHVFHRLTSGKYDHVAPDLSNPTPGGYGKESEQHDRLLRASKFDRTAALKSTSWGAFQIMGFNYDKAGYPTLQAFVNAMYAGVDDHLRAFCCFIRSIAGLEEALRARDWPTVKVLYNGPGADDYERKLELAYQVALTTSP